MRTSHPRRNPRHTSKLESLPSHQREQLDSWLRQNLTYSEIATRVASEFGIKTAPSSLSNYFSRHVGQMTSSGESAVRDLRVGEDLIEFEIVTRVRIRRSDLAELSGGKEQ